MTENIKCPATESLGDYELKQLKPWFDDSRIAASKKVCKYQWLQALSQRNEDNMNSVRRETSRTFRNK
jgi:hypothetical protein